MFVAWHRRTQKMLDFFCMSEGEGEKKTKTKKKGNRTNSY